MIRRFSKETWAALIAAAFGLSWFIFSGGGAVLLPWNVDWTMVDDWAPHQQGWMFFRNAPWSIPLGRLPNFLYPVGSAVGFTDSIPWIATAGKLLSWMLPADFQYMGPYLGLCFALQGYWGARLVGLASPRPVDQFLGGALFTLTPVLLHRLGHDSLCAHWTLLALLWANLRPVPDEATARRTLILGAALVVLTAGIHPYLMAMVLALALGLVLRLALEKKLKLLVALGAAVALPVACVAVLALHGYFAGAESAGETGFGTYAADLVALVNPMGWSRFIDKLQIAGGAYEGFAYLGLGVLGLVALAVVSLAAQPRQSRTLPWKRALPFAAASVAMAFFALSSQVRFEGQLVWDLSKQYEPVMKYVAPFRSSGRFVWSLYYLVFAFGVLGAARALRLRPVLATAALGLAFVVQLADVDPSQARTVLASKPFRHPNLPAWEGTAGHFEHLALFPPQVWNGCPYGFDRDAVNRLAYLAYRLDLTFNSGYVARLAQPATSNACAATVQQVVSGALDPKTIYLVLQGQGRALAQRGVPCGRIDGDEVCVSPQATGPFVDKLRASPL